MLEASRARLVERVADSDVVLDIGGWGDPLPRADWVIDLMPYETRGLYERQGWVERAGERERFGPDTWIQRDICEREPLPFADDQIDFVVCSHTLEDLRDPVWVCDEMTRVARAGYLEVPSRLEEQTFGFQGELVGWPHHRWLVDVVDGRVEFVFKNHSIHSRIECQFPPGFRDQLSEEECVHALWWEGRFDYGERIFMDPVEGERWLSEFVEREMARRGVRRPRPGIAARLRRRLA